ncbi:hypothetical protein SAMN05660226_00133 [Parapedobacter luteus]|uniref:Uncharacterized protein n=2 Tax=Parapedobacter luteus TaxID=623280 RepID=A0A1T4ZUT7_9SPHI|nr:hypothetical protein SAMN05660226_00133 [Parapedobacter luteus]
MFFAGVDAGYGFFAPNVSSGFILEFKTCDSTGAPAHLRWLPDFTHQESYIRYSSLIDAFQDKLIAEDKLSEKQHLNLRRLNAIMRSIATSMLAADESTDKIEAAVYLYHFPSLEMFRLSDKEPSLLFIDQLIISAK